MIEARHTSHSGAISKSGGKLATLTKPFVSLIARLSNDAMRIARDSTNPSRSESGNDRLTYPYSSATSPGMSSAPRSTSSARPRPIKRGNRAIGPLPGTTPAPTSNCDKMAFSRLAKRMSQARASSLPTPVARPRIDAIDTTGARLRRTSIPGRGCKPVGPGGRSVVSSSFARKS